MGSYSLKCLQLVLVGVLFSAIVAAQPRPNCPDSCGSVSIPYPFGVGKGCYLNPDFNITCSHSHNPPKPYLRDSPFEVTEISLDGQLNIRRHAVGLCYGPDPTFDEWSWFSLAKFRVSNKNKFTVIGCNSYGYLQGFRDNKSYSSGCLTICEQSEYVDDQSCSGSGCCQIEIPTGLYEANVSAYIFTDNGINVSNFSPCTYAFIVEESKFKFSPSYLRDLPENSTFPVVLDWSVDDNITMACKGNATRDTQHNVSGYHCRCEDGYEGNPYLGCYDIDECKNSTLNKCHSTCVNIQGNYTCTCPKGYHGDGRKDGQGCIADRSLSTFIVIGVGVGLAGLFIVATWLYWGLRKWKLMKLKEKFFKQNGGLMLLELSGQQGSTSATESTKLFTAEELERATDKFDERTIIGQGGYGTVYKGTLVDGRVVAIKKSKVVDQSQISQFINEVVVLSQINHRNVVKLLGCCLETEVPLLVYEFVTNGTLFEHIHNKSNSSALTWEIRLRIAAETAGVLSYLHSAAVVPIIHRDIKSNNILLDENYTAKVSDFGTSRLVPMDQEELSTMVQGTLGYLDPEYLRTSQLTDKSDVYSFGVVLGELLTGQKALSFDRREEDRNLTMYFLCALKDDRLLQILDDWIVNENNIDQLKEVANLAKRCLRIKGEERPSMREVAMELDGLRMTPNHPWVEEETKMEEMEYLLGGQSPDTFSNADVATTSVGYDTIRNHIILPVNDAR